MDKPLLTAKDASLITLILDCDKSLIDASEIQRIIEELSPIGQRVAKYLVYGLEDDISEEEIDLANRFLQLGKWTSKYDRRNISGRD